VRTVRNKLQAASAAQAALASERVAISGVGGKHVVGKSFVDAIDASVTATLTERSMQLDGNCWVSVSRVCRILC
jgi:hypothetical protein